MSDFNLRGASAYNAYNDPRNWDGAFFQKTRKFYNHLNGVTAGSQRTPKYRLSKCRRTKSYRRSALKQRTITAPISTKTDTKYLQLTFQDTGLKSNASKSRIVGEIPGGSAESQRVGNDVRILKYWLSFEILHGSSTLDQTFKFFLVRSKTGNSNAVPSILTIVDTDYNGVATPASLRNVGSLEDYEILWEDTILVESNYANQHGVRVKQYMVNTCFPQRYSDATATNVIRNPVFLYMVTNCLNVTTGAQVNTTVRVMYSDI